MNLLERAEELLPYLNEPEQIVIQGLIDLVKQQRQILLDIDYELEWGNPESAIAKSKEMIRSHIGDEDGGEPLE